MLGDTACDMPTAYLVTRPPSNPVNNALLVAACAIGVAIVYFGTGRLNSKRHKAGKKKTKPKQK